MSTKSKIKMRFGSDSEVTRTVCDKSQSQKQFPSSVTVESVHLTMSSRSGSSSSSSPEPPAVSIKDSKKSQAKKTSTKPKKTAVAGQEKNEGTDLNWAYKPPKGSVLLEHEADAGEFDWDSVKNDDDTELWLIRVPDGVRLDNYSYSTSCLIAIARTCRSNQNISRIPRLSLQYHPRAKKLAL